MGLDCIAVNTIGPFCGNLLNFLKKSIIKIKIHITIV
ncbi:MAG: hypothetical protein PWQ12_2017 [Clostridiales bacterium]|jgi:hypothetical protein|nr:hypothetical protein [Clostridiales bacterium]